MNLDDKNNILITQQINKKESNKNIELEKREKEE